jgi:DNA-directed RNA polymerase subunit RPC12/RpoP
MEIITMTCRQCGAKLTISRDADQIICQHCGTEYLVSFQENTINLKILSDVVKGIYQSTDKTASELALDRLRKEKKNLFDESNIETIMREGRQRGLEKYHLELDIKVGESIGIYEFSTTVTINHLIDLRSYCERCLENEKERFIPDKYWLGKFADYIQSIDRCIPKLKIILEQEDIHKKVVIS